MFSSKEADEWGSAILVLASGALVGHYAALGMTPVQWAGAAVAVLGSLTVAAAVRLWPAKAKASGSRRD
jgi:hypothetical protein